MRKPNRKPQQRDANESQLDLLRDADLTASSLSLNKTATTASALQGEGDIEVAVAGRYRGKQVKIQSNYSIAGRGAAPLGQSAPSTSQNGKLEEIEKKNKKEKLLMPKRNTAN